MESLMESLNLSVSRAIDEGVFKGIQLDRSISISHLFYADDAMFIGEWSDINLKGGIEYRVWCVTKAISILRGDCGRVYVSTTGEGWVRLESLRSRLLIEGENPFVIGGRFDLLERVLGAISPLYNMSGPKGGFKRPWKQFV
ncbi:hypothetical protein Tco_1443908 [Tanacetum coccineum]